LSISPFDIDRIRNELLSVGDMDAYRASYSEEAYPELEDMSSTALWDDLATYDNVPEFRIRRLTTVADNVPVNSKVLDIGVGWGEIIPMLKKRQISEYVGLDFSEKVVSAVSEKFPDTRFKVGTVDDIDELFDVVLALEVCEHILASKIMDFYKSIYGHLKEGGRFIVTVPVYENLKAMTLKCPHCDHMHNRMGHVRSYSPDLIKAELELAGFTIKETDFIYFMFSNDLFGRLKRTIIDVGRRLFGMQKTVPLNIVVVAEKFS